MRDFSLAFSIPLSQKGHNKAELERISGLKLQKGKG
jgi:hypothetical protein